tara:strand:- start:463 stop:846 length:384 start_codon:yes stop_codon:yes gene_type:complete
MKCIDEINRTQKVCNNKECRQWIDYGEDQNCVSIAVGKHGRMTLREVAKRLGVSYVRVKQIQDKALQKLFKKIRKEDIYEKGKSHEIQRANQKHRQPEQTIHGQSGNIRRVSSVACAPQKTRRCGGS